MTAFVLVSGSYTGGWIWREVAARLRESGAEVHAVTLTGMGDRRHLAGPDTELETHIEDLVQVIDHLEAPEVVIVGHDYGIHPVLGAADRRPDRVARIVYLDSGLPLDGESVLDLLPDPAVRERLVQRAEFGWRIAPPSLDEWPLWGSTAGVPADALARLVRLATPQPLGTLTQPLRLSGALARIPTSGILCTANGSSIAMVKIVVRMGDPRYKALTDPRVGFFELETGHWPMLSAPDELAEVLIRAAAGEGQRVPAAVRDQSVQPLPFLLDVPEQRRERVGQVDLYLPADTDGPRPAVVFVHGGPFAADLEPKPRDWPTFVGYGQYAASLGVVGVTVDHRLHGLGDYGRAAEDVAAAVELARADPRVDGDRVALWFFSGGGLLSAHWLAAPPAWLRCVAASYPVLAPPPSWGLGESPFHPAAAVGGAGELPIVVTRVGLEVAEIAVTVEQFLAAADDCKADVEVIDVPLGHHGFESIDHTDEARQAVERAVRSVLGHLQG
ncbi:pimeloyl-ACP methyl ester carboxylesterase [Kitasatospora sp. MAP12-15]|uniref:alpha/beta hydrolase n=1 Tax=unclassified Kitasatospora TaxID=2633591 RepID=UPI0024760933|nr:alpha/beta hydrolase [Kitasatospora sp. MAP12-44]MDH6111613.1 pimeloyl-ACP methyl ester carboxylesterase [Kitasatospora sp. MAP12-44]